MQVVSRQIEKHDSTVYRIVTVQAKGFNYEIITSDRFKSIDVFRTRVSDGEAHALQRTAKTFWSWEEVKNNYKNLALHIEFIQEQLEQLKVETTEPEATPEATKTVEPQEETATATETVEPTQESTEATKVTESPAIAPILYITEQERAKDRVIIKRRLRVLGVTCFDSNAPTLDLALTLKNLEPDFIFPPKVQAMIDEHFKPDSLVYLVKLETKRTADYDYVDKNAYYKTIKIEAKCRNDVWDNVKQYCDDNPQLGYYSSAILSITLSSPDAVPDDNEAFDVWLNTEAQNLKGVSDTFEIKTTNGSKIIDGVVYNGLVIHKSLSNNKQYTVTHLKSGAKLQYSDSISYDYAKKTVVLLLATGIDWTHPHSEIINNSRSENVLPLLRRLAYSIERCASER